MNKFVVGICLAVLTTSAYAQKTYTPSQLNRMVASGQYPEQGPVSDTQTRQMSFSECKVAVERIMAQLRDLYPVETIVDTGQLYMVKAWTNDGAVTATCSDLDRKMVLTTAQYI